MIGHWTFERLRAKNFKVHYFPSLESTNLVAKEKAMAEDAPSVFYVTETQTLGRGQGANRWINSTAGTNLLITGSLQIHTPPQPDLCLTLGEQLRICCSRIWPSLKWKTKAPNDLLLDEKKVAGILLESVSQGTRHRLLFGLGFNILDFPKESAFTATCLQSHLDSPLMQETWNQFVDAFLVELPQTIPQNS